MNNSHIVVARRFPTRTRFMRSRLPDVKLYDSVAAVSALISLDARKLGSLMK